MTMNIHLGGCDQSSGPLEEGDERRISPLVVAPDAQDPTVGVCNLADDLVRFQDLAVVAEVVVQAAVSSIKQIVRIRTVRSVPLARCR